MNKDQKIKMIAILHRYKWLIDSEWKDCIDKEHEFIEIDQLEAKLTLELQMKS